MDDLRKAAETTVPGLSPRNGRVLAAFRHINADTAPCRLCSRVAGRNGCRCLAILPTAGVGMAMARDFGVQRADHSRTHGNLF